MGRIVARLFCAIISKITFSDDSISPMSELRYYFNILEIPVDASYEEAKAAYRDLVDVWHPDRYSRNTRLQIKATEKLKQINTAWQHLDAYYRTEKTATNEQEGLNQSPLQIRCEHCHALNNVPRKMAVHLAKCGACGTHLGKERAEKQRGGERLHGTGIAGSSSSDKREAISIAELAAGLSVGLIVMLILFLMKNTLF